MSVTDKGAVMTLLVLTQMCEDSSHLLMFVDGLRIAMLDGELAERVVAVADRALEEIQPDVPGASGVAQRERARGWHEALRIALDAPGRDSEAVMADIDANEAKLHAFEKKWEREP